MAIALGDRTLETAWWGPPPDQAPTLVLLHEGLGCVELWRDVPAILAQRTGRGVLAYSRFGYGQSDPAVLPRPMTYMHDEATQILPRVLDAAGIRRAVLIGHSDGGSIAAIHAGTLRDPRIAAIVAMAAHFFVEEINISAIQSIKSSFEQGDLRQRLARYHKDVDVAFHGWNDAWLDPRFRNFDITDCVQRITVPILGLQGTDDPYGTDEQLNVLEAYARAPLEVTLIAGARHSPHLEAKEPTLNAITGFVARHLRESAA